MRSRLGLRAVRALSVGAILAGVVLIQRDLTAPDEPTPLSPVTPPPGVATGAFDGCANCHEDLDEGLRSGDIQLLSFTHEEHFDTGTSECSGCHPQRTHGAEEVTEESEVTETNLPSMNDCFTCHVGEWQPGACALCHPAPHPERGACAACHGLKSWEDHFDHAPELAAAHMRSGCETCHVRANTEQAAFPEGCPDCHEPPHPTRLGALELERCAECHRITHWTPTTFDHPPSGCIDCHGDHHNDPQRTECQQCHSQQTWAGAAHTPPLSGDHRSVSCGRCHTLASGSTMGYPAGCVDCHRPPHPLSLPRMDLRRCYDCHTIARWSPPTFNHPASGCVDCHGNNHDDPQMTECQLCHSQSTWSDAEHPDADCTACHRQGEMHSGLSTRCQDCHATGEYWVPSTYQHPQVGEHWPEGSPQLKCFKCHTRTYAEAECKCHRNDD